MPIHHVDVKQVGAGLFNGGDITARLAKSAERMDGAIRTPSSHRLTSIEMVSDGPTWKPPAGC